MNILYVYAHPQPNSLNAMLKTHALNFLTELGVKPLIVDLYGQHFNPIASFDDFNLDSTILPQQYFLAQNEAYNKHALTPDIADEIKKIKWADHIIFQFPFWWFSVPAILKGWLDRILVKGFAYDVGKAFDSGLLKGKEASFIITTQSPESAYTQDGIHQTTMDHFLLPITHTLKFVGINPLPAFVVYGANNLNLTQLEKINNSLNQYLKHLIKK